MAKKYFNGPSEIIHLSIEIGELLGVVNTTYLRKPSASLARANKIKAIHSTISIDGNSLSEDQITKLLDGIEINSPEKEIIEAQNTIEAYNRLSTIDAYYMNDLLSTHDIMMQDLLLDAGRLRSGGVGEFKNGRVAPIAPAAWNVQNLITDLFIYLNQRIDHPIIKSCVFHYQMKLILPFSDGNGRMARLWQKGLLMKANPVFEFIPIETEILDNKQSYFDCLTESEKDGDGTVFITYMMRKIKDGLHKLITSQRNPLTDSDRIHYFKEQSGLSEFTRKDYLQMFKDISGATASRDMKKGVEEGVWRKIGDGRTSRYVIL